MNSNGKTAPEFDVAILGTGLAGTMLGAILAKRDIKVLCLDAGSHPRFVIGESTIPYTSVMMRIVAERFDIPEIKAMSTFESVRAEITTNGGVKRNFGFVWYDKGKPQSPEQVNQFSIPNILHTENHFFRQDMDSYMLSTAIRYGVHVKQQTRIEDFEIDDDWGVTLKSTKGEEFTAKYLIDASGHASPVAKKLGLRDTPCRFKHQSRSMFTHMIGVKPLDECLGYDVKKASRWHEGTLHHLFPGGWMWVIPFDNHPRATNPLVSIGLNLDPQIHGDKHEGDPQDEFCKFVDQYPEMARQFANARAVRPWISTGRLQYSSNKITGKRWCLTSHAAGFVDALFSRGLTNTLEVINALAPRLIRAIKEDDFNEERFDHVEKLEQGLLEFNDRLVYTAYSSFADFDLWNATFRIWALSAVLGTFVLQRSYVKFLESRNENVLNELENLDNLGFAFPVGGVGYEELLDLVVNEVTSVREQGKDSKAAAAKIFDAIHNASFVPPAFGFDIPDYRDYQPTLGKIAQTMIWSRTKAPPEVGEIVREGLLLFMKKRWSPQETPHFKEEVLGLVEGGPLSDLSWKWFDYKKGRTS